MVADQNELINTEASHPPHLNLIKVGFLILSSVGLLILLLATLNIFPLSNLGLPLSIVLISIGVIGFSHQSFKIKNAGIKNDGVYFSSVSNRGTLAWVSGILITLFYILLYWYPQFLGYAPDSQNTGLVSLFDPLSHFLKGQPASQWFVYGTLYTVAILIFGIRFIWKYRHNRYQVLRTLSVMFFQLAFAFLIPELLQRLNYPYYDFKNMWPLNYYFFYDWNIKGFLSSGQVGMLMLVFGLLMIFVISPILTYYFGKRWYCSWVCGCGGLAETAGDPFRHLSDKSLKAWQFERWIIHLVLLFAILMTVATLYSLFHDNPDGFFINKTLFVGITTAVSILLITLSKFNSIIKQKIDKKAIKICIIVSSIILTLTIISYFTGSANAFFIDSNVLRQSYGFLIGAAFSGVIGVGFYPIFGSRVWCRFGCPMAAILGIQQKLFSKFRITTNGGQCISCGNCSTYCEMGIDVRHYAQRGQDIVRASCVGCGICAAVCPRGVLRLENASTDIFEKGEEVRNIHLKDLNNYI